MEKKIAILLYREVHVAIHADKSMTIWSEIKGVVSEGGGYIAPYSPTVFYSVFPIDYPMTAIADFISQKHGVALPKFSKEQLNHVHDYDAIVEKTIHDFMWRKIVYKHLSELRP